MKRLLPLLLALLLAIPVFATAEEEKVLNILTWAGYFDYDTIIAPFIEETGIKVNYDYFDSNEEMLIKLQNLGGGTYDIVLASDYIIEAAREEGLLLALDKNKIPNWENIDPLYQGQYYDPEDLYTIPYAAGTPLIVYDPAYVDIEITGYNSLWDESLRDSLVLIDDARNIIGITLKSMGESFNTTDEATLEAAAEKLMLLKPNIRALDYNQPHQILVSGEASVGYMFTPFVELAIWERPDLVVVYPEEGMGFGIDCVFVPVNAPHPDNAHLFLDFLLRPEIGAAIAEVQLYLNCNLAAVGLLSDEYKASPVLFIPDEIKGEMEFIENVGDAQFIYYDIWTRFKQY